MDQRKLQSIVEWAKPTSCSEARRFTGLANYSDYRRFLKGYTETVAQLTVLCSLTTWFERIPATQASFNALKLALSSALVLRTFDPTRHEVLTTDTSNITVTMILMQPDDGCHQHTRAAS